MAKRQGKPAFVTLGLNVLRGLEEADASGKEILAYAMLTRYHNDAKHPSRCWCSAAMAEDSIGMSVKAFSKALSALTRKCFTADKEGRPVPVITRLAGGHNGRAATYEDNLYRMAVLEGTYPRVAPTRPSSSPICANYENLSSSPIWGELFPHLGDPEETYIPVDTASPPAKRSGVVSQPHKKNSDTLSLVTGGPDARAAAAALGGAAPALPTLEEYRELERRLDAGEYESLTEAEKDAYHAGHAAYAAKMA